MNFEEALRRGQIRKSRADKYLARSLFYSSKNAILSADMLRINKITSASILREYYEALRQICESIIALKGFQTHSHEAITIFLREQLSERKISIIFDRYRKLRNMINYYGRTVSVVDIENAKTEIANSVNILKKKYLKRFV